MIEDIDSDIESSSKKILSSFVIREINNFKSEVEILITTLDKKRISLGKPKNSFLDFLIIHTY